MSIVIPVLNEAGHIVDTLRDLQVYRRQGHEIIVVDGGSEDGTQALVGDLADCLCDAPAGRGRQMNRGAKVASGEVLLFLHADTRLPENACQTLLAALSAQHGWGRFDVRLSGRAVLLRGIEFMMNVRSRVTQIATGDQAMFVRRPLFEEVGGFPEIPLMEDIALSRILKCRSRSACLRQRVLTSSRRWEEGGILRTILLMWRLRFAYWLGADPADLVKHY